MDRFLMVVILGVFIIYITVYCYRYLVYRKVKIILLRFMTSCMMLFTCTIFFYNGLFFDFGIPRDHVSEKESRVFVSSYDSEKSVAYKENNEKKITAYFDNANPGRGTVTNLIVTGPRGGKVTAICHYKGFGTPYIMNIGNNGQAVIPVKVDNNADPGYVVVVDISVNFEGRVYKINSVFTPK